VHDYHLGDDRLRSYRATIPLGLAAGVLETVLGYHSHLPVQGGSLVGSIITGVITGMIFVCLPLRPHRDRRRE
jgi:hypothetical protein